MCESMNCGEWMVCGVRMVRQGALFIGQGKARPN